MCLQGVEESVMRWRRGTGPTQRSLIFLLGYWFLRPSLTILSLSPILSLALGPASLVPGLPVRFRWVLSQQSVLFSSLVSSFLSYALYSKCWDVSWGLRTRKILLQARRREKKSEPVLLDTSEIKSIWLAPEQHSFSKTAELTTWNVAALKCNVLSSWLSRFIYVRFFILG